MGIFDKAKDLASGHEEQVDQGLEKAGDLADEKTARKYSDKIDQATDKAGEYLTGDKSEENSDN